MKIHASFTSVLFVTAFLALCLVPWVDTIFNADPAGPPDLDRPAAAFPEWPEELAGLNQIPDKLESSFNERFGFRRRLLRTHAGLMTRVFHTSPNPKVVLGSDHWLFYEPDIRYLTSFADGGFAGRKPGPLPAIIDFHRQLRDRNIRLILLPVPVKPMLHPEKIGLPLHSPSGALQNPAFARFKRDLEREDILLMDPAGALEEMKAASGNPVFLRTDTHWTPETAAAAAGRLASFIEERVALSVSNAGPLELRDMEIVNSGDLAAMLPLDRAANPWLAEKTAIARVVTDGGGPWTPDENAEILFLGDSFANIFSLGAMGWGESAGLVEHLSFSLNRPVDRIVQNDNGAYATRLALQNELAHGRDRLAGKKVVIWEFAVRELAGGDWKMLDMKPAGETAGGFFTPAPGEEAVVTGVIAAVSEKPVPLKSPYKDHVISLHLVNIKTGGRTDENREALVYITSMKDNRLTAVAALRVGQEVTIRLRHWNDVSDDYGSLNRSELDDENLLAADPCWGEEIVK